MTIVNAAYGVPMVSQKFMQNLLKSINKDFKGKLSQPPHIQILGTPEDTYKGAMDEVKTFFIPFRKSNYSTDDAQEFVFARIFVQDRHFSYFDFVTPVLNIKEKSLQGIGTFIAIVPNPIPETYVERSTMFAHQLVPHQLAVEKGLKVKEILKKKMITSDAINAINEDKWLRKRLNGFRSSDGPSDTKYKLKIRKDYPPGTFTVIPYYGHSIILIKDTGSAFSVPIDYPIYTFKFRYEGLSGVAKYLAKYPERGQEIGPMYVDEALEAVLPYILKDLTPK